MNLLHRILNLLPRLWGNWISILGTTLTTVSGNLILIVAVVDIVTEKPNKYAATFGYMLMPMVFALGLVFIGIGVWRDHRQSRVARETPLGRAVDLVMADTSSRRRVGFVVVATFINITLISVAAFKGVTYMDSPGFCGQLCHSVMEPEYGAYIRSPHARVPCVDCHIGEGASWFARSKISGLRQVWATLTGDFNRPIPTPIHHLRPARETCEKCHWPQKFHGERLMVRHSYKSDEKNTRMTNVVRLNVGGVNKRTDRYEGIHWHVAPEVRIEYEALDAKRKFIGKVVLSENGKKTVYMPPKTAKGAKGKVFERRVMDCVDCHNRPTHVYDPTPAVAVDRALALGKIDLSLPFIRKQAITLLGKKLSEPEQAAQQFVRDLKAYYQKSFPEVARSKEAVIQKAGRELGWIYRRNIFPVVGITWGAYPNHIGHRQTTEGCFRCHDDEHQAKGDKVIRQDCDICHEVLAEEEEKPDVPEGILKLGRL
jgi:nitrate/TMAO reductase-like tetraheme cytochrome c subunit